MPAIDAQQLLRAWRAATPRQKRWAVGIVAVLLLLLLRLAGCGGSSLSEQSLTRAEGNKQVASLLDKARQQVLDAEVLRSSSAQINVEAWYIKRSGTFLLAVNQQQSRRDRDGRRWLWNDSCWDADGRDQPPSALNVVLPLDEPTARFDEPDQVDGFTELPYTVEQLGSWPAGAGSLRLDRDDKPLSFTYTQEGSSETNTFRVSYPLEPPAPSRQLCR